MKLAALTACVGIVLIGGAVADARGNDAGALLACTVRFDGSGLTQVAAGSPVGWSDLRETLTRSADGRSFAYVAASRLYAGDTGTLSVHPVTPDGARTSEGLAVGGVWLRGARFSPDGRQLAFTAYRWTAAAPNAVYVADADGTGFRELVAPGRDPTWSSDGTSVAYTAGSGGNRGVYVASVGGGAPRRIAHGYAPLFAPKGDRLAYVSGNATLAVANIDGSARTFIEKPVNGESFIWAPGGRRLFWTTAAGIRSAQAGNGWRPRLVLRWQKHAPTDGLTPDGLLSISPRGDRVAYARGGAVYTSQLSLAAVPHLLTIATVSREDVQWTSDAQLDYLTAVDPWRAGC